MEQNKSRNEFYDGSEILSPFTTISGLPIDQANFLACQLIALVFGYFYRIYLAPQNVSPTVRHLVQILIGVPLTYFCFGRQIVHLLAQSLICLLLMRTLEPGIMENAVLVAAMAYLCIGHTYRLIYDYGGYTLDITGPLMVNTQRLSSLAFSIADGRKNSDKLSTFMKKLAVKKLPSVLESMSYVFCFHNLMCGPFCFYNDYISFIDGSSHTQAETVADNHNKGCGDAKMACGDGKETTCVGNSATCSLTQKNGHKPPNPMPAFIQKFSTALFYGMMTICVLPMFPVTIITGSQFSEHSFLHRMFLVLLYAGLQRQKYYFAWKLGESANVIAGLGFNGYDEKGVSRWDLIDNADIVKVELSTSLKELLDNWNRSTTYWLRYVIYDRVHSTLAVICFSAFWHGFYAGYYATFFTGGLFIHTARLMTNPCETDSLPSNWGSVFSSFYLRTKALRNQDVEIKNIRRRVRPMFLVNRKLKFVYDAITFTCTRLAVAYLGFPFLVLGLEQVYYVYSNVYFWMHFSAIFLACFALVLPIFKKDCGDIKAKAH